MPVDSSRRDLLTGAVALGVAAAVSPAAASTIDTSAALLHVRAFHLSVDDGALPAYEACPGGGTGLPILLVVPEIFGLHAHIADVCRRFALAGFHTFSWDPFRRVADVTRMTDFAEIRAVVQQVPDARVLSDLDQLAAYAAGRGGDASRLGVTGFCWGGRITWLYAAHRTDLGAGVAWYGRLRGDVTTHQPRHPIDVASALKAPVLGLYGGADTGIPQADVDTMLAALKAAGRADHIEVFPGAQHAFFADYRPSYDAAAAKRAWELAVGFLKERLDEAAARRP